MKDVIKHILTEAINKIYADDKLLDLIEVQNVTAKNIKADFFSNISMKLAKKLRIKPLVIADEIVKNCTTCVTNSGNGVLICVFANFLSLKLRCTFCMKPPR